MSKIETTLAVIGAGNMGGALMAGLMRSGCMTPDQITAVDPAADLLDVRRAELGIQVTSDARTGVVGRDVVVLAVKPQVWADVVSSFQDVLKPGQLLVSIMAGVRIDALERVLDGMPVVRVMPNILAQVGAGGAGICPGTHAKEEHLDAAMSLLNAVGTAIVVREDQMDAVTGLAGSGPAYVYTMIDALADGGVRMGLTKDAALSLAVQTVLGAARMVAESGDHPAVLKDRVASPGGTTIAGLHALERGGLRAILMEAVEAATLRSVELGA